MLSTKNIFLFLSFITNSSFEHCPEFLYPVGPVIFEESERICVLYQKGDHLELLLWDPVTKKAIKGLSHQTPAGLMILPSRLAFSFIDHERVRIKSLAKKSAKTLDLYPLYDFNILYWIDDENYYCSAREYRYYNLFHVTLAGDYYRLTTALSCEYTYPQKVNNSLFYIKKDLSGICTIEKTCYPIKEIDLCQKNISKLSEQKQISLESLELTDEAHQCALISAKVLITNIEPHTTLSFLTMYSETEGFYLKHLDYPFLERTAKYMNFECWQLIKNEKSENFTIKKLFTFFLPLSFLYGEQRLYEAILRLVPHYYQDTLFYVSANDQGYLNVYRYELLNEKITCYTNNEKAHYFFTPIFYQGNGFLGGMITDNEDLEESPTITLDAHGTQVVTFPILTTFDLVKK